MIKRLPEDDESELIECEGSNLADVENLVRSFCSLVRRNSLGLVTGFGVGVFAGNYINETGDKPQKGIVQKIGDKISVPPVQGIGGGRAPRATHFLRRMIGRLQSGMLF